MIMVDIFVPILNKTYDFNLNEDAPIGAIVEEVTEMVCHREHWPLPANAQQLVLSDEMHRCVLLQSKTLRQSGIINGSHLILT